QSEKGVPIYLHDWYGAGRHAMVVSTKSGEYKAEPGAYRSEESLTGDESRVREVKGMAFPKVLQPVDDLPPTTVVTAVRRERGESSREKKSGSAARLRHPLSRQVERARRRPGADTGSLCGH